MPNGIVFVSCRATVRLSALAVAMVLLPGCQTGRMALPETLSATERMPVSGRQGLKLSERLRFGSYEAHQVSRSSTRGRDRGAATTAQQIERRQTYRFTLREGERDQWFVACHASLVSTVIELGVIDLHPADASGLYCNLRPLEDPAAAWELELREERGRALAGTLALGASRVEVLGTHRLDRALPMGTTTGYELRDQAEVLGAVEVINHGAVWLREDLSHERRSLFAAAAAALLLHEDLQQTVRE